MTDDELDRALFTLPLEAPPADLRARILATTVDRPRLTFRAWEIWVIGTLLALAAWIVLVGGASTVVGAIGAGVERVLASISTTDLVWVGLGMWFAVVISQLSFPQPRRGHS